MSTLESLAEWLGSRFANTLTWWQWSILAAVPPAIVLLYFLKLRRRPIEVPSTFLWHKSIEDLHVNSVWQRLRRNLLLLLQLLLILVAALALLRPSWQGKKLTGNRLILLIDNSASMQASDVNPTRLDEAKRRAAELIDQMHSGDAAMIISFADSARVEQTFTDDRRRLYRALEAIGPTERSTSLVEALQVASGLANPGRSAEDISDVQVAEALPADLFIFSDGKFGPVTGFSLGNLRPTFVPIGSPTASNVGIVAFSAGRGETRRESLEAFARLENFGPEKVGVAVELYVNGVLDNAARLEIGPGETQGMAFPLEGLESGVLRLKVATDDDLGLDNEAFAVVTPPRRARVLLVTPGNEPLEMALQTKSSEQAADVQIESPEFLKAPGYQAASGGANDLIIFDRRRPERMPLCNTLFIGILPPQGGWSAKEQVKAPLIIDVETSHPLLQWIDLSDVVLAEAAPLIVPAGGSVLVDSDKGPLMAIAPREREEFEDAVMAFPIVDEVADKAGQAGQTARTNWPIRPSFPVFILNLFDYLGGSRSSATEGGRPGSSVPLEAPGPQTALQVRTPSGKKVDLRGGKSGRVNFTDTDELGVYEVRSAGKTSQWFPVNLFDAQESNVRPEPNPSLKIGYVEVPGESGWKIARREFWKELVMIGLAVLLLEWYIYRRRIQW